MFMFIFSSVCLSVSSKSNLHIPSWFINLPLLNILNLRPTQHPFLFRRISALSMKVLLEMCKDQEGDLALGKMLGNQDSQELGGMNFILSCILKIAPEHAAWPWWLGRLLFLRRLMDEFVGKFQLVADCPQVQMETVGVLVQEDVESGREDLGNIYRDNLTRLMSVLKFAMQASNCSHSKVAKLSVAVLICCTSLASRSPSAFIHVKNLVMKLKPAQRSSLQRRLTAATRRSAAARHRAESHDPPEFEGQQTGSVSSGVTSEDLSEGAMSLNLGDYETDNMSEVELLQSIVESLVQPNEPLTPQSSLELDLNWPKSEVRSPRHPPLKLALGKKCQDLVEQEEAEAIVRAMEVSVHERGPPKIPNLQPATKEEMVIVYAQPDVSLDLVGEFYTVSQHLNGFHHTF